MWNINSYKNWLLRELYIITQDLGLEGYEFRIYVEQSFSKSEELEPNVINIVLKQLSSTKEFTATVQPIQMLIIAEENGLEASNIIFNKLFDKFNWFSYSDGSDRIKMQYTNPVVLNNFNIIGVGYRSVLYVSITLYILENVVDLVDKLIIDGREVQTISFSLSYSMSGDTKPFPGQFYAKTVRSVQTMAITIVVPCVESNFLEKVFKILNGSETGNLSFNLKFTINNNFDLNMKMSGVTFVTQPNAIPSIQIGFIL